ncbi:MAG: NADH-quinone oxidoreductase subunit NuoE family protein, partial [Ramlibacter sp.]
MNHPVPSAQVQAVALATADQLRERIRRKSKLKGRQPDEQARAEVRECIGAPPPGGHRRDLLIEHLHRLNDRYGALREPHLVALSRELNLPMAEIYEVATFYHHFEVVAGDATVPALTVRVCDGLACELAGAKDLLAKLPAILGTEVRVIAAPCIGRCEQAPAVAVHQRAVPMATPEKVAQAVARRDAVAAQVAPAGADFAPAELAERSVTPTAGPLQERPTFTDYATYRANGGYALPAALARGETEAE